ncbi:hypothetical protein BJ322DRAFT_1008651, partial [Thelephora terrestris]
ENLTSNSLEHHPAVNQVEHPRPGLLARAKLHDVPLEDFYPPRSSRQFKETLELVIVLQEIAKGLEITPPQVIISWHV